MAFALLADEEYPREEYLEEDLFLEELEDFDEDLEEDFVEDFFLEDDFEFEEDLEDFFLEEDLEIVVFEEDAFFFAPMASGAGTANISAVAAMADMKRRNQRRGKVKFIRHSRF